MEGEKKTIDVPPTAYVPCPAKAFAQVGVRSRCIESKCPYFLGLECVDARPTIPFENAFRVHCAHPIHRRMSRVEVEG